MSDKVKGLRERGNINLFSRPHVVNPDGSVSTVRSLSFEDAGREILIPTVSDDGRVMSDEEAIAQYYRSRKHLGIFDNPQSATTYAQQLHDDYAAGRYRAPLVNSRQTPDPTQLVAALQALLGQIR